MQLFPLDAAQITDEYQKNRFVKDVVYPSSVPMRPRHTWSIYALLVASAVGCSGNDPPASNDPSGRGGAGAGSFAGGSAGGAAGTMMPSQMGNGPPAGQSGTAGTGGAGGASAGGASAGGVSAGGVSAGGGVSGKSGTSGVAGSAGMNGEMGRLVGITAAHNAVRSSVDSTPPLPPLVWSDELAQYAQQWADELAATSCSSPHHRSSQELQTVNYGENLAAFISSSGGSTAQQAVNAWAAEKTCYTFGALTTTDKCDTACYTGLHSDGCGHYTQIVWRASKEVGCGVASCPNGGGQEDIWICNYSPPGNFIGRTPY
ncbi:MAG: CAP domain-containing protein [Polyangiaceae bacterium]